AKFTQLRMAGGEPLVDRHFGDLPRELDDFAHGSVGGDQPVVRVTEFGNDATQLRMKPIAIEGWAQAPAEKTLDLTHSEAHQVLERWNRRLDELWFGRLSTPRLLQGFNLVPRTFLPFADLGVGQELFVTQGLERFALGEFSDRLARLVRHEDVLPDLHQDEAL